MDHFIVEMLHLNSTMAIPVVDVIIPAYNEEKSIGRVLDDIPKQLVRQILVCDNNSTDNTSLFATEKGAIIVDAPFKGYGNACLAGIRFIHNQVASAPPDIMVFLDADYSDHPDEMFHLISAIQNGHDLVIGSRVLGIAEANSMTDVQLFGNWLSTHLIKYFYGYRFTDLGPFRAIRWDKLLELNMQDQNFGWTVEMQVKAAKHKLKCTEVPVSYRKRIGKSKISGTIKGTILAGYKIIWTIIKHL